jgi:hypothetical protein
MVVAGRAASADRLTISETSDLSARSTQHQAGAFNEINNDKRASSQDFVSRLADL